MSSLILVPSMGRPESAKRLYDEFSATSGPGDEMIFIVPDNDPMLAEYRSNEYVFGVVMAVPSQGSMSGDLNVGLDALGGLHSFDYIAFLGDDHSLKSTPDWSMIVDGAGFGIIYGPDGSNNLDRQLPTFWFVSREIVEALGWLAPPYMKHFYIDDAWREIGLRSGTLKYVPELYIEHLHFSFGKSDKDATYDHTMRVGGGDHNAYQQYRYGINFFNDVNKVLAVMP